MKEDNNYNKPLYLDCSQPFKKRIDNLVERMSLTEKISQLTSESAAVERLNIPKYYWGGECLHGVAFAGIATVFPQAIGLAATWNTELIQKVANAISDEARAKHHEALKNNKRLKHKSLTFFSPNINIFRDPRWGRGQETYGEDPYLTSRMGVTFIKALQGNHPKYLKLVATPKHYAVHSGPESERHRFNAIVNKKDLWETYLPAFQACIREAKAFSIMPAYNRVNGEHCCASAFFLIEILKRKWGFKGYIVSDANSVSDIFMHHRLVNTPEEAIAMAMNAGCDLLNWIDFLKREKKKKWQWIRNAIEKGFLPENVINQSVKRLFDARFKLGMFDPPEFVPYAQIPFSINDCEKHRALALQAARESIVLLKNENNLLPLDKNIESIGIIGPNADDLSVLLGNYNGTPSKYTTPLQGIKNKASTATKIYYIKGCNLKEKSKQDFDEAIEIVQKVKIVIMVLGISPRIENEEGVFATLSDANGDRLDLNLPDAQEDLLKKIHAIGKSIILLLMSGSALSINFAKENIPVIIQSWYPGEEGGKAIADVIFGDFNPAGRLPITFYKSIDQLPKFEDYSMQNRTYKYFKGDPLFPFGFGLSFTKFKYSNLKITPKKVRTDENLIVSVDIENIGNRFGDEVIQLYVSNLSKASKSPIRELQGFKRIQLNKREKRTISFTITPHQFSRVNKDGKRLIEPGTFSLSIGGCQPGFCENKDMIIVGDFKVIGEIIECE